MKLTDEEINYRIFEVINFVPCDDFKHIRDQLKKGKWFFVKKNPKNPKQILQCLIINLSN